MNTFIFCDKDIIKTRIRAPNGAIPFYTASESGWFGARKVMTLKSTAVSGGEKAIEWTSVTGDGVIGAIDWKHNQMELWGQTRRFKDIKSNPGWFGKTREWQWGHQRFTVGYSKHLWEAKDMQNGEVVATFSPYKTHWFSDNDSATLQISQRASNETAMFLILVLIYMEIKRQDDDRNARNASTNSAVIGSISIYDFVDFLGNNIPFIYLFYGPSFRVVHGEWPLRMTIHRSEGREGYRKLALHVPLILINITDQYHWNQHPHPTLVSVHCHSFKYPSRSFTDPAHPNPLLLKTNYNMSSVIAILLASTLAVHAAVLPNEPGPGSVYREGENCHIAWGGDSESPDAWKDMTITLRTGSNLDMKTITQIATGQDGSVEGVFDYPCPDVTPQSAIYFYEFTAPGAAAEGAQWTTRFTIAAENGDITEPTEATQPDGDAIPWGTGALESGEAVGIPVGPATTSPITTSASPLPTAEPSPPTTRFTTSRTSSTEEATRANAGAITSATAESNAAMSLYGSNDGRLMSMLAVLGTTAMTFAFML